MPSALREHGYISVDEAREQGVKLAAGTKLYAVNHKRLSQHSSSAVSRWKKGMNILGAHIDSPAWMSSRIRSTKMKTWPIWTRTITAASRSTRWVTLPLAIHGVVARKDGTVVDICIGEKDDDPVFVISDLLVHLSANQMQKNAATVVEGENLDLLIANRPLSEDESLTKGEKGTGQGQRAQTALRILIRLQKKISPLPSWKSCPPASPATAAWIAA